MTPATLPAPTYLTGSRVPEELTGVEIVSVGMNWPASTGDITVTFEHIADAIVAANDDPHIQVPRLKLGHTSALNGDHPDHDPFAAIGDAQPAFGRWVNLRATNDGATLVADADYVLDWLAASAPSDFPNRSMECVWDVVTPGDRRYSMVITAVSLIGAYLPACRDLDDLQRLVAGGPSAMKGAARAASRKENDVPRPTSASVSYETVRQRFNFEWATDPESIFEASDGDNVDPYWWWARDIRLDPNEVIADDDEGNLWSIPFETDGDDGVTFGRPQRVRTEYVPVAASAASFTRPTKPAPTGARSAASARLTTEEASSMTDEQRRALALSLRLSEDATEEAIHEAAAAAGVETETETPPAGVENPEVPETETPPAAAAASGVDTVTIDRPTYEQLRSGAADGSRARAEQLAAEREGYLSALVGDGVFVPAAKAGWAAQLAQGGEVERATRATLDAMPKGTVPLEARGEVPADAAAAAGGISDAAYENYLKTRIGG